MTIKYLGASFVSYAGALAVSLADISDALRVYTLVMGAITGTFFAISAYRKWRKGE